MDTLEDRIAVHAARKAQQEVDQQMAGIWTYVRTNGMTHMPCIHGATEESRCSCGEALDAVRVALIAERARVYKSRMLDMRYWLQVRAPAGNWVDSLGSDDKHACVVHGRWLAKERGEHVRVVERTDVVVWPQRPE